MRHQATPQAVSGYTVRIAASLLLAMLASPALAAAIDCQRANGATQTAVCRSKALRDLDRDLASADRQLHNGSALGQREQRRWLIQRDHCLSDPDCIGSEYQQRLALLQARLAQRAAQAQQQRQWDANAYQPDQIDKLALADLKQAVNAMRQSDGEFPLDKVLARLQINAGLTSFDGEPSDPDDEARLARLPHQRPKGVTPGEWRALLASGAWEAGENNAPPSYTLIRLDGRAQRDLIVDTYTGGTGLYSYTTILRQKNGKFIAPAARPGNEHSSSGALLYSINGRGANQGAIWIKLRGRSYVAYINSRYGSDTVYLLRPFTRIGTVPTLTVRYRYQLSVPKQQAGNAPEQTVLLDDALHAALTQALALVSAGQARADGQDDTPICPVPETVTGDDRLAYNSYGPGHYTFEIVADMPIWLGGQCHLGRLVDWFGAYDKAGLVANLEMRKVDGEGDSFTVHGRRSISAVESSMSRAETGAD